MTNILRLPQPVSVDRVETGPMQFGDDWPGVFIRGDNALQFASVLQEVVHHIPPREWLMIAQLNGLANTLQSCSVGNTGWPPVKEARAVRDAWIERFEKRKQELIDGGMTPGGADAVAGSEVIAELRHEP